MRFPVRRKLFVGALAGTAVVLGAGAGVVMAGVDTPPDLSTPSPGGQATSIPSELASSFAFLRRPQQPSDALTGAAASGVGGGAVAHYGINPSLARLAGSIDGSPVWFVPGSTGSCIVLREGGSSCGSNELAAGEGVYIALVPTSGAPATVVGIVPDGAHVTSANASGSEAPVSQSGQAFRVSGADGATSFTIHTPNGGSVVQSIPTSQPSSAPTAGGVAAP